MNEIKTNPPFSPEKSKTNYLIILILLMAAGWFFIRHRAQEKRNREIAKIDAHLKQYEESLRQMKARAEKEPEFRKFIFRIEHEIEAIKKEKQRLEQQ